MKLKELLSEITKAKRGVKPAYTKYHVLKCLLLIYNDEPIGRIKLSKALNLGETSVRTLLSRLKELDIINIDRVGGVYLSDHGRSLLKKVMDIIHGIQKIDSIYIEKIMPQYKYVYSLSLKIPLRKLNIKLTSLRDIIIRSGADAALILIVENGKLCLPYDDTVICEDSNEDLMFLRQGLNIDEAKTILLALSSRSDNQAEKALIGTLIELMENDLI